MQKRTLYPLLLFGLLLFSCQQDAFEDTTAPGAQDGEIRFDIQATPATPVTRIDYTDVENPVFSEDDAIGVYGIKRHKDEVPVLEATGHYMENIKFTMQEDGSWLPEGNATFYHPSSSDSVMDFYAYYPYAATFNPIGQVVNASEKCLTARTLGVTKSTAAVGLMFTHKQMLLRVNVVKPGHDALTAATMPEVTPAKLGLTFTRPIVTQAKLNLFASSVDDEFGANIVSTASDSRELTMSESILTYDYYVPPYANGYLNRLFIRVATNDTILTRILNNTETPVVANTLVNTDYILPTDYTRLANCYVVKPGAEMHIPVYKAYRTWKNNQYLADKGADLSGDVTAELLWMDADGLITNADALPIIGSGEDAIIRVKTAADKTGNAVIAMKTNGTIRWSWHLWMTDYIPVNLAATTPGKYAVTNGNVYAYDNNSNSQTDFVFMDRNLGAMNATVDNAGSKGLYYQGGRKDPFVGTSDWTNTNYTKMYNAAGEITEGLSYGIWTKTISTSTNDNIGAAVTQPQYMYIGQEHPWGSNIDELWGHATGKSVFDPCPAGWKIPPLSPDYMTSPWNNAPVGTWNTGKDFGDVLGYYPATGYRDRNSAALLNEGSGYLWEASSISAGAASGAFIYYSSSSASSIFPTSRAYGYSVRCVAQ